MHTSKKYVVEQELCGTFLHYHQHYVMLREGKFLPLWYRHCGVPGVKNREPNETCPHWAGKQEEPVSLG